MTAGRPASTAPSTSTPVDSRSSTAGRSGWRSRPTSRPTRLTWGPKRICTWVRLRDRLGGRTFRVYNTHLYLTERARLSAVRAILARIGAGDPSDAVLVAGDFNAGPDATSRRLFPAAGLVSGTQLAGQPARAADLPVLRDPPGEPRRPLPEPRLAAPRLSGRGREAGQHLPVGSLRNPGRSELLSRRERA